MLRQKELQTMQNNFIKMTNKANDVDLLLYDVIGEGMFGGTSAMDVVQEITAAKDANVINVRINSPGGDVFEGFAIYNALRDHAAKVIVNIDGYAASIASVIAMAGDEINIAENAMLMIHNPWAYTSGGSDDLRKQADLLDQIKGGILKSYARSGLGDVELADMMDEETWLDASEAIAAGLADNVTTPQKMAAVFDFDKLGMKAPANVAQAQDENTKQNGQKMTDENNEAVEAVEEIEAVQAVEEIEAVQAGEEVEAVEEIEAVEAVEEVEAVEAVQAAEVAEIGNSVKAESLPDPRTEARRFMDAFGDAGGKMYADGMSFEDATVQNLASLRDVNAKQAAEIADLKQRINDQTGESEGLSGGENGADSNVKALPGGNLANSLASVIRSN
jgi:ATP-dependent Clp protease, protease subunit